MKIYRERIIKIFNENNLFIDRLLSMSKSNYKRKYPYNSIIFNANVFIKIDDFSMKVWYGDLDLSLEGDILKKISKEIGLTLYVLHEMDGRFENEDRKNPDLCAVWNTTENTPIVDNKYIRKIKKEEKENERNFRIRALKEGRKDLKLNKTFPIKKELQEIDNHFIKKIKIPYHLIEEELNKIQIDKINNNLKKRDTYFKDQGYLTAYVLDKFLKEYLAIDENKSFLNPSAFWISPKTNKKLKKLDFHAEKIFKKSFKFTDFKREVTCNYCVPNVFWLNSSKINIKSYENDYIYIRDNYEREII